MPQNYSNCFPNGTPPTEYTGNGVETTYNVGFPYQYDTDVLVTYKLPYRQQVQITPYN